MALQPKIIACGNSVASFAMAVRFITGPAVMAAASVAVGLRGVLLHIAIVQVKKCIPSLLSFLVIEPFFYQTQHTLSVDNVKKSLLKFSGSSSPGDCPLCLCKGIQCSSWHSEHWVRTLSFLFSFNFWSTTSHLLRMCTWTYQEHIFLFMSRSWRHVIMVIGA